MTERDEQALSGIIDRLKLSPNLEDTETAALLLAVLGASQGKKTTALLRHLRPWVEQALSEIRGRCS